MPSNLNIEKLIETLEHETSILLNWFQINEMKSNNDKNHLLIVNNFGNVINVGHKVGTLC